MLWSLSAGRGDRRTFQSKFTKANQLVIAGVAYIGPRGDLHQRGFWEMRIRYHREKLSIFTGPE